MLPARGRDAAKSAGWLGLDLQTCSGSFLLKLLQKAVWTHHPRCPTSDWTSDLGSVTKILMRTWRAGVWTAMMFLTTTTKKTKQNKKQRQMVKTYLSSQFLGSCPKNYLYNTGCSDENPEVGLVCFDRLPFVLGTALRKRVLEHQLVGKGLDTDVYFQVASRPMIRYARWKYTSAWTIRSSGWCWASVLLGYSWASSASPSMRTTLIPSEFFFSSFRMTWWLFPEVRANLAENGKEKTRKQKPNPETRLKLGIPREPLC